MDDTSTLRSLPALLVGPGLHLHFASGDKGFEVQQGVGLLDQTVNATLLQAQFLKEHLLVLVALEFGDILLCLGCDDHSLCTFFLSQCFHLLGEVVATLGISLAHIANVEHGL